MRQAGVDYETVLPIPYTTDLYPGRKTRKHGNGDETRGSDLMKQEL